MWSILIFPALFTAGVGVATAFFGLAVLLLRFG
jgi:hypothetical protein